MIIDCCKMTPVQSQYCMFSMIISCHFSHMFSMVIHFTSAACMR
jgi:hypothetical protein